MHDNEEFDITSGPQCTLEDSRKSVDTSCKNINEPVYVRENELYKITFFPSSNMYPYKNDIMPLPHLWFSDEHDMTTTRNWFNYHLYSQQIEYAIKFLQPSVLKKCKFEKKYMKYPTSLFRYLLNCKFPYKYNKSSYIEIAKILVENIPDHEHIISELSSNESLFRKYDSPTPWYEPCEIQYVPIEWPDRLDMLYSLLKEDPDNICFICLHTQPKEKLLNKLCKCKTSFVHVDCFIKFYNDTHNDVCKVCNSTYRIETVGHKSNIHGEHVIEHKIYFPFHDYYYPILMNSEPIRKFVGMARLSMAINYLHVERVDELLCEPEVLNELPTYLHNYPGYKQTPIIALCTGNIGNNYHINLGNNFVKYVSIMIRLVNTKKIDLDHKDAFGRTALDYAKRSEITYALYGLAVLTPSSTE